METSAALTAASTRGDGCIDGFEASASQMPPKYVRPRTGVRTGIARPKQKGSTCYAQLLKDKLWVAGSMYNKNALVDRESERYKLART